MSPLRRLCELFVAPPAGPSPAGREDFVPPDEEPDRACAEPAPRTPPGIAVLAPADDAHALGAALALALAGRRRARVVVVCGWSAGSATGQSWRAPAMPAARRLATALGQRGHDARAGGRLALVRLAGVPLEASAEARRALAAAGAAPTILALGGPRVPEFDALLAEQDLVVVGTPSGTDPVLGQLALAGLAAGCSRACVCEVPPAHPARALAAAGLALLPSTRRPLAAALEAMS